MTATLEGVTYLVEGVTLSPMPSSSVSSPGKNLYHFGRTTTAPFTSLPPWRHCLGSSCRWWSYSLIEEDPLLHLSSLSFLYIVQVVLVIGWWMLCRPSLRWQILCRCWRMLCCRRRWLEFSSDGCFAIVVGWSGFGRMLCRRCWLVGWMLLPLVCVADLRTFDSVAFCRFSYVVSARFVGSGVASCCSVFLLCFSRLCVRFFSVSLF